MINKNLGKIREKRAKAFLENNYKWFVQKTNLAIDKYHSIDFECLNSKNEKCFVQVKGYAFYKKKPDEKAIHYAKKCNAKLYYCFVPNYFSGKILLKKVDYGKEDKWSLETN